MRDNKKLKTIIVGAGLGGLIHGILLKKARPDDEVVIYDSNKIPGGFCTAFEKIAKIGDEKIKYTVNIPLLTSDFGPKEPFDLFLDYMGVKNIKWNIVNNLFQYYPLDEAPFLFTKDGANELLKRATSKERKNIEKFFEELKKFYQDVFHRAYINPTPLQSIELLLKIPKTIFKLLSKKTYLEIINRIGIESKTIKEILSAAEAFMGVDVDKVSAVGEMLMIQSFLENNAEQPADGYNFQDLSDNLAERFKELGGKLILNTKVDSLLFDGNKVAGVKIKEEKFNSNVVVLAVAQDRIEELLKTGNHISKISKLTKKIKKLPYPNTDFYCYYLLDKKVVDENPRFKDIAYHVYKLPEGRDRCNWKLAMSVPDKLYNNKYYILWLVMFEQDQKKIDEWMKLRDTDYKKYNEEKEKMADLFLKELQEVEPVFKKNPPIKHVMTFSPASYLPYGSKYPISGLAQTPDNFAAARMSPYLLDNLFISGGASFSAGLWGAIAGGWQGFVAHYEKVYGIKIGNHDVLYKPGLKNLP